MLVITTVSLFCSTLLALVAITMLKGEQRRDFLLLAICLELSAIGWMLHDIGKHLID